MAVYGLSDFADIIKRQGRYGLVGTNGDQQTKDILASINIRRMRIWSYFDWSWALEQLATAMIANQTKYTILSKSGNLIDRITDLIPQDSAANPVVWAAPLQEMERQAFYAWWSAQPSTTPDIPAKYVNLGMDANFNWKIELAPAPSQAFTLSGYGKKILTKYAIADITANTAMDYFPSGIVEGVLLDGCLADSFHCNGNDTEAARLDALFEAKLKMMRDEQANAGHDDSGQTQLPPPAQLWRQRMRSKSGTGNF